MSGAATDRLNLEVTDVVAEARDVVLLELRDPHGHALPPFEPGAHLEIQLGNGLVRHYSLTNDARERERYVVGVGRAVQGRGGSEYVHQQVRRGTRLTVSAPRNHFRLEPSASRSLFIAGGIGITPIASMVQWCDAQQRPWRLVYAARCAQRAAFYESLARHGENVRFHFDDQHGGVLDVAPLLATVEPDEHVYCCGPAPLVAAVKAHAGRIAPQRVHFEYFTAPADAAATPTVGGFTIELRKSARTLVVPPDQSILDVLEANGFALPFSCREGLCRTCETTVCAGEPEHRDYVLSADERRDGKTMMICVSRAASPTLVLDL
ncbi:MAG: oxidoreductase [Ideonella sp.]|nr:oxidoreductase [Ideonella sp.]MCC7456618.1 oxidoreductase [Nitrospira sp.]